MARRVRFVLIALGALFAAAFDARADDPALLAEDPAELARTWERAWVALPGAAVGATEAVIAGFWSAAHVQAALARVPPDAKLPVVVFLHGCTGIELEEGKYERLAPKLGFAIVFPDSFARRTRGRNCDPGDYSDGQFPAAYPYRWAEARHARAELAKAPWVDQSRVVLAGFSEGGIATALYDGADYAAYLVTGWTCHSPRAWMDGLRVPEGAPLLAVVMKRDPWTDWPGWRGDCGAYMAGRGAARSFVVEGSGHAVLSYPEAQKTVREFLGAVLAP